MPDLVDDPKERFAHDAVFKQVWADYDYLQCVFFVISIFFAKVAWCAMFGFFTNYVLKISFPKLHHM